MWDGLIAFKMHLRCIRKVFAKIKRVSDVSTEVCSETLLSLSFNSF